MCVRDEYIIQRIHETEINISKFHFHNSFIVLNLYYKRKSKGKKIENGVYRQKKKEMVYQLIDGI